MHKYTKLVRQLAMFGVVGVGSLLIDLCVTTVLYNHFHCPAYLAGPIGFLSAFFFNFPINRRHVFNHTKHDRYSMKTQIILYASLSLFNLLMTGIFMQLLVAGIHFQVSIAKICVTAVIAIWNFLIFKFFIFSKRPQDLEFESLAIQ